MKIKHPGWQCCTDPALLAWWVRFRVAWVVERMAVARAARDAGEHGRAWAVAQPAMIVQGHTERVAEAHGIKV